jgi:predicted transcriptional regulator
VSDIKIKVEMLPYLYACRELNQFDFAKVIGVHQSYLSLVQAGQRPMTPQLEMKILQGIEKLKINSEELLHISLMVKLRKSRRGYH